VRSLQLSCLSLVAGLLLAACAEAPDSAEPVVAPTEARSFAGITRGGGGADIGPLMAEGVPGAGLVVDGSEYFWYHHTAADTVDKLDAGEMQRCVAALAILAYVVAEMPERLPR
jgi:carboxypeptidase Q